jgi:outer membrane beta-barrel protein
MLRWKRTQWVVGIVLVVGMAGARNTQADDFSKSEDEYSFNWLDPDKKIYVLQNRKYLKSNRLLLSVMGGVGFSNPYRSTYNVDPRMSYYFNETWGIEVFYTLTGNSPNTVLDALQRASPNTLPNIREIRAQYGGMLHYVPWYAKINVFNSILYFDWYFGAGAGTVQTYVDTRTQVSAPSNFLEQDMFSLFFCTGHQFHLSQSWVVRIDVTGAFYQAPINGTAGDTAWYSNYNFGVGIGLRI